MYDYLVVGAGLFGAVFAHEAHRHGKSVLVLEKRKHLGGNIHTEWMNGICVHSYGAHIFHTNHESTWNYVNQFARFNSFINRPKANYRGTLYSLPFNMHTFQQMWDVNSPEEARQIIESQRREITGAPSNLEEQAISMVGRDIYEKLVQGYTEKQWGRPCRELPAFIIQRLPVRFTYDDNYFNAKYQGIPIEGYTAMVENMLKGIEVRCNTDFLQDREYWERQARKTIFTGAIDSYFGECLGSLEYRSLRFEIQRLPYDSYQGNAVINYTDRETPYTRIIEHKWFAQPDACGTIISREYSLPWKKGLEPYYPINDARNDKLYEGYKALCAARSNIIFGGRLGEYKYYDMDCTIEAALASWNSVC